MSSTTYAEPPHSISELLCSSGFCCKGPRQVHSLRQDTPLKVSWFLKRKHNSFHGGIGAAFFEALAEVLDIVNAWKAHVLARDVKYDSFPRSEGPDFLIKHAFIAGMFHLRRCVGTVTEPHGADVIG